MSDLYIIKLPLTQLVNKATDPMHIMLYGGITLSFNEMLGILTDNFIAQYHLFPLKFNPTDQYSYTYDNTYLYIKIPKSSVDTQELENINKERKEQNDG